MSDILWRLILIGAVILVAWGLGMLARRKLVHHPPVDISAVDFGPGLIVFTSAECRRCRRVLAAVQASGAPWRQVPHETEPEAFAQAGVVGVPLTVVVDTPGRVAEQFAGLVGRRRLQRAWHGIKS